MRSQGFCSPEVLGSCLFSSVVDCLPGGLVIPVFVPGKKGHCRDTSELSVVLPYLRCPVLLGESLVNSLTALFRLQCRLHDRTEELAGTGFCFVSFFSAKGDTCTLGYTWSAGGRHSGIGVDVLCRRGA